jgi:hypothetical protein
MIQFYFLSILFNAVVGYLLAMEDRGTDTSSLEASFRFSVKNETFRLILGILTMLMGLLKILSSVQGDVPVIGDLIPALTGMASGFILAFDYYQGHSSLNEEKSEKLSRILGKNRRWIGFAAMASAALHFLFPSVLFL